MVALSHPPISAAAENDGDGTRITFSDALGLHVTYTDKPLTPAQRLQVIDRLKRAVSRLDAWWRLDQFLRACGFEPTNGKDEVRVRQKPPIAWSTNRKPRAA